MNVFEMLCMDLYRFMVIVFVNVNNWAVQGVHHYFVIETTKGFDVAWSYRFNKSIDYLKSGISITKLDHHQP